MLEYDREKLGKHIKRIRVQAGLTQIEVSNQIGHSSPQFISNIERGVSVAPLKLLSKVIRICKAKPDPMVDIILSSQESLLKEKFRKFAKNSGRTRGT